MPSSIPFDHPSLVLGNIVNPLILEKLKQISGLQSKTDAAQSRMNSQIALKRSITLAIEELKGMNVKEENFSDLTEQVKNMDKLTADATIGYIKTRQENETGIQKIRDDIAEIPVDDSIESPVDFTTVVIENLDLSSNSLKLDAQYFSFDNETAESKAGSVENFVKEATAPVGNKASSDIAKTASAQIIQQSKNNTLSGTLIITASCTHKKVALLSPCNLDPDKAVSAWNKLFKDKKINTSNEESVRKLAGEEEDKDGNNFSIISGATYGSSFVGMAHLLKNDVANTNNSKSASTSLKDLANSLQEQLTIGNWLKEASGSFGIDGSIADDVRKQLNKQQITSHITVIVMGALPSIKSNQLKMGVRSLNDISKDALINSLSAISNATSSEKETVDQSAKAAKTGAKVISMREASIQSVLSGLGKIDQSVNKMMDTNSLLTAFEDYLEEVKSGESGIPISFYLKTISQHQIARLWMKKYYPDTNTSEDTAT